ncbi:hypothetical protein Rhe02_44600 [Rhizocola hellebori]|uniref:Tetratricopeptide repeat protein n=1 Tax=Rhizocola hellebori TaxID=1392758 RepID=A0A8J3Q916_9ACTN|nr:hypothetical protein [Rhizocola hellebori]GIH06393.1 hypothetical protein Rhe02_44600 [Rhizocola hellebori]
MPDSLERARQLVARLDFPAAQQLLRDALSRASQDPAQAEPDDADVAVLYAGVLLQLTEPHTARSWAGYAHSAMRRLHGERDRRTLHALGVLAVAEHRAGALDQATRYYQQLVTALTAVDGPDGDRTLAARADATFVDHARGLCSQARQQLAEIISVHAAKNGPSHPVGIRMIVRLAGMWRDCGEFDKAHQLLTHARAQTAALAPEDDTHRVVSQASRATADQNHRCGAESTGPHGQPGVFPILVVPEPQDFLPAPRTGGFTAEVSEWPEDEILDQAPASRAPTYLPPPAPPPPPMVVPPRQVPAPITRQVVRQPVKQAKPGRSGALVTIMIGAAAAAAVALVAVAIVLTGDDEPQAAADPTPTSAPGPTATATAAPIAVPSGPVSNLRLVDQGDRLLITWLYPPTADGPLIVSAAKAGEPMRALQSLPAGTESLTLPGLDPQRDYCVAVTVAYRSDHMVMSTPVCTDRKKPSP